MKTSEYIPEFDFLRAAAVLVVMFYHVHKNVPALHLHGLFRYGFLGVDLFFVLSGFLITGILLRARDTRHYFLNFYARRVLRIWPLYFAILGLTFLALPHFGLAAQIREHCQPEWAYPLFIQNLLHIEGVGPVTVTWSLAIEEQFYAGWPLLVFLLPVRYLRAVCISAILFSGVIRFGIAQRVEWDIYSHTLTRLDGLAAGCLIALYLPQLTRSFGLRLGWALTVAGTIASVATIKIQALTPGLASAAAMAFSGVLLLALCTELIPNIKSVNYLGQISYGLYLLHVPVFDVVRLFLHPSGIVQSALVCIVDIGLCILVASGSWFFLERPILSLKSHFAYRPRSPKQDPQSSEVAGLAIS